MRNVLMVLVLIVVAGAGLGYYLGWFNFSSHNDKGESNITLSVDKDKIEADKDKVANKIEGTTRKAQD